VTEEARPLRIGVIGGGSIFTPELSDLLGRYGDRIGPVDLRLMDIDPDRLSVVAGLCERIAKKEGHPVSIRCCDTYETAIEDADFVLVQFRVGGEGARIADDRLGLKYRIPFVETVSVCGFAAFIRSYFEVERIASIVQRLAPDAWVMDFANPAGMLAEAFSRLGCTKVVGVCNSSIYFRDVFAQLLGCSPDELFMNWRGLNHLTYVDVVRWQGRDVYPQIVAALAERPQPYMPFPQPFLQAAGFLPNYYLRYHYFAPEVVEELQARHQTRAEEVKAVNARILELYRSVDHVPDELRLRGGFGYSRVVANAIRGLRTGDRSVHYLSVRNGTTLAELPPDSFVEVPVLALENDLRAIQVEPLPALARSLIVTMKHYEMTLFEAARTRDRRLLLNALMIHPLIGSYSLAEPLLRDVLDQNRAFVPAELLDDPPVDRAPSVRDDA
jgi:6-phospho-beta-glucosidase